LHPLTPLAFTLDHGAIEPDGMVEVRMVYDHRVTDGAQVARILHDLERVLNCEILSELRYLQSADAA
jgi:pyruvate/2-oxoglutarate dehydrogenase complex dihydrolipoamide acyltransferase (E2) component